MIILTSGEWPPYYSASLPDGGLGNKIISEAFAVSGITVIFRYMPWKRALVVAREGPAVGSAGWLRMEDRERVFLFSDPVFHSQRVFFHLRDKPFLWESSKDLEGLRIAISLGSAEEFPLWELHDAGRLQLDVAASYASGMRKVAAERVDAYACNLLVGLYHLERSLPPEVARRITFYPRPIFEEDNHLIISRRLPDAQKLIETFNQGLAELHSSGRYDEILNTYPLPRVDQGPLWTPDPFRPSEK